VLGQSAGGFRGGEGVAATATVTNFGALFRRQKQLFLFMPLMRISTEWTLFLLLSCGLDLRTMARSSEIVVVAALWAGGEVRHYLWSLCNQY
jgi:hypothetical protein